MTNNFKVNYIGTNPYDKIGSALQKYYRYSNGLYYKSIHNEFDIMGPKSMEEMDKFIEERMVELSNIYGSVGEITRYENPVGYLSHSLSMIENYIGTENGEDLFKRTILNLSYSNPFHYRYMVIEVSDNGITYLNGSDDIEDAKGMAFALVNPMNDIDSDSIYYIRDMVTDEYHKCSVCTQELIDNPETLDNATQVVCPLYEYICYGHI